MQCFLQEWLRMSCMFIVRLTRVSELQETGNNSFKKQQCEVPSNFNFDLFVHFREFLQAQMVYIYQSAVTLIVAYRGIFWWVHMYSWHG